MNNIYLSSICNNYTTDSDGKHSLTQDTISNFLGGLKGSINVEIILDKKPDQQYHKIKTQGG
jgi:hypothetical protein